jgi:protein-S-isoprenylcysteine O-methyltransferase Ste14
VRKFFTSLFAFFISGFAGSLVALGLAIATDAQEEYILVFMASALVTIVVTLVFFIAQFFSNAATIIDWLALCAIVLFVLVGLGLIGWTFSQPIDKRQWGSNLPIVAGLVLPTLATVVVHWLFVRWRVGRGLMDAQVNA